MGAKQRVREFAGLGVLDTAFPLREVKQIRARGVMLACRNKLDTDRIRTLLGLLEQALAQSDLLPAFEREWEWATSARPTTPRPRRA